MSADKKHYDLTGGTTLRKRMHWYGLWMQQTDWELMIAGKNCMVFCRRRLSTIASGSLNFANPIRRGFLELVCWFLLIKPMWMGVWTQRRSAKWVEALKRCRWKMRLTGCRVSSLTPLKHTSGISFGAVQLQARISKKGWRGWCKMQRAGYSSFNRRP